MLKTTPNIESKNGREFCKTVEEKQPTLSDIPQLNPIKEKPITGPIEKIDCDENFLFEKQRVKAIENTDLFISVNTTINEQILSSSKIKELLNNHKSIMENFETTIRSSKEKIINIMKFLCTILSLFTTLLIVIVIFGILFLSMYNFPLSEFTVWFLLEFITSTIFIIFSIQGSNIAQISDREFNRYFKYVIIYAILLGVALLIMELYKNIQDVFICSFTWNSTSNNLEDNFEPIKCIVSLSVFCSCIYKIAMMIVYIILC